MVWISGADLLLLLFMQEYILSFKNPNAADKHIGYRLKLQRTNIGMSQEALGDKISLSFQQIQKYEKGINRISAARLYDLASILGVELSYFFEGMGHRSTEHDLESSTKEMGMSDSVSLPAFMDFVSSNEGVALNRAFTRIADRRVRRAILDLTKALSLYKDMGDNQ